MPSRPSSVACVAVVLVLLAVVCAAVGVMLMGVSACCGSPKPPDSTYALVGLAVAGGLLVAAWGLWTGSPAWWVLLAGTSALPIVCLIAGSRSADLIALLPFALAGWGGFWVFLRRPAAAAWVQHRHTAGRPTVD
jgi:hypothetical protein